MKIKSMLGAVALGMAAAPAAQAMDFGAHLWSFETKGDFQYDGDEWSADSRDGFNLDRTQDGVVWANFRHPLPILPNVKVMHTRVGPDGTGTVSANRDFGGFTFGADEDVAADLTLDQTDITLYYNPLKYMPTVDLDLGLNIKYIDGDAELRSRTTGERERTSFSGALPMAYARGGFDLPFTGLSAEAVGSLISYDGHRLEDLRAGLRYELNAGLGIEGGYRRVRLKLDDLDDVDADLRMEGPYIGLSLHL